MMRITNSMMMSNTKSNINGNKVNVDKMNTQMSTQKKITKPSDDPLIAIKSLRLSTTLSQIHQYYDNNMSDAESWMDVTETAMTNMKSIMTDAYRLTVNGATDTLTEQDRNTIYTQLNSLSSQLYAEANADYANRTVFSGFKTDSTVAFTNDTEAAKASYSIEEGFSYSQIEVKDYYANKVITPAADKVSSSGGVYPDADPKVLALNRARLGYDKLSDLSKIDYSFSVDTSGGSDATTLGRATIATDSTADDESSSQMFKWDVTVRDGEFHYEQSFDGKLVGGEVNADGKWTGTTFKDVNGFTVGIRTEQYDDTMIPNKTKSEKGRILDYDKSQLTCEKRTNSFIYKDADGNTVFTETNKPDGTKEIADSMGNKIIVTLSGSQVTAIQDTQKNDIDIAGMKITKAGKDVLSLTLEAEAAQNSKGDAITNNYLSIHTEDKGLDTKMMVKTMTEKEFEEHLTKLALPDTDPNAYTKAELEDLGNTMIFLPDSGEVIIGDKLSENLTSERASVNVGYDKNGFTKGEVRPEMYYNCVKKTDASEANHITYTNFDEAGNWINQKIDYAISSNQYLGVNTQIHDVINSDTYRDMQEMINTVKACIDAHTYVDEINKMINSGEFTTADEKAYLKDALEAAQKQADYFDDNLHNVFSKQLTRFEGYLNQINLAITEIGSRGNQLELAKNRMGNQQTTFKELKSNNEDAELSDITIDYTSAYTAYQASLQAAGKIDDMSLLDYL